MSIDLDEAKDRAERGLLLTARHGEALVVELKRLRATMADSIVVGQYGNGDPLRVYGSEAACLAVKSLMVQATSTRESLHRFYDREPLVQKLVTEVLHEPWQLNADSVALAVRDFAVE